MFCNMRFSGCKPFASITGLSRPALLSADFEFKLWFTVLLNVIHCLLRSVAHPVRMHICIQKDTLGATLLMENTRVTLI